MSEGLNIMHLRALKGGTRENNRRRARKATGARKKAAEIKGTSVHEPLASSLLSTFDHTSREPYHNVASVPLCDVSIYGARPISLLSTPYIRL